jgi:predicted site-specific integrase-resolvase
MGEHIMDKMMTFIEVCKVTGINRHTMQKWLSEGQGPKILWTPQGRRRFRESDVITWIANFFSEEKPKRQTGKSEPKDIIAQGTKSSKN